MTIQEVLKAAAEEGIFPQVEIDKPVKHAKSNKGKVTTIRPTGVTVRFEGLGWDTWLWAEQKEDSRSRYVSELKLI